MLGSLSPLPGSEVAMNNFETLFANWVVKYRWWIIAVTILCTTSFAGGLRHLTFKNDKRVFFSKENPQLQAFERFEDTYTKDENVGFAIAPKDGNVFTRRTLTMLEELTEACWKIPYSSRVDSIINFQHTRGEDDELIVEDLVQNPARLTGKDIQRISSIALSEPTLVNILISPSGHVAGMLVTVIKPGRSLNETSVVANYSRKIAEEFRHRYPDIAIHLTGTIMIDDAMVEATQKDLKTLVPITCLALFLFMGLLLRTFIGTICSLLVIAASVITGVGLAGWIGIELTPVSANAPGVILTLGVADSVHILVTLLHQARLGKDKYTAIVESMRINLQPIFLTSVTTSIGFLTMNFSDAPPLRDLGNIVAMGVMAALVYSLLFLPALVAVLPIHVKPKTKPKFSYIDRLAEIVIKRHKVLFWVSLAFIPVLAFGILRIELNDDFIKYYDQSFEFRRASDFVAENLSGIYWIEYSLDSGESQGVNNPEYLKTVDAFVNWYRSQANVVHVNTVTHIIKRLNMNIHHNDETYYRIPNQRDQIAQLLLLYEISLPFGLDLNNQINVDKSATRISVTMNGVTSRTLIEMDQKARKWLAANAPESMQTCGVGTSLIFAQISKRNIKSMLGASLLALFIISLVIMAAMRTYKIGFVFLVPNVTPIIMAFGLWGFIVGRVGLAISVIAALTLGIIVDDSIHFISKYLRARREYKKSPADAVRFSFHTVGRALWVTTAALVAGFSALTFSGFQINSDLGWMTIITIVFALILDFLFLPTLLMKAERFINVPNTEKLSENDVDSAHVNPPLVAGSMGRDS